MKRRRPGLSNAGRGRVAGGAPLSLTARDMALLEEVGAHRAVPIEHLAERYFQKNPLTGETNVNPEKACDRRIGALMAAGYLMKLHGEDGRRPRTLVATGAAARRLLGPKGQGRVPVKNLAHHARTLDAIALLERDAKDHGGRVVAARIEQQLRSELQRGRLLRAGDSFSPFPDAVCEVFLPGTNGMFAAPRQVRVAVEYATSKYTDEDIRRKHEGFAQDRADGVFDEVRWFCDRPRTRERVQRITGACCEVLR